MPRHLVCWFMEVDAESEEQAALKAANVMPSSYEKSTATKFAVTSEEETIDRILEIPVTYLDLDKYFIWLREQVKEKDET